jgi:hypothetical protein
MRRRTYLQGPVEHRRRRAFRLRQRAAERPQYDNRRFWNQERCGRDVRLPCDSHLWCPDVQGVQVRWPRQLHHAVFLREARCLRMARSCQSERAGSRRTTVSGLHRRASRAGARSRQDARRTTATGRLPGSGTILRHTSIGCWRTGRPRMIVNRMVTCRRTDVPEAFVRKTRRQTARAWGAVSECHTGNLQPLGATFDRWS